MSNVIDKKDTGRNIARNVAHYRQRAEMSRYALAKAIGVGTIQITRIETERHCPGSIMLAHIAEALGVTADDLLNAPEKKSSNRG